MSRLVRPRMGVQTTLLPSTTEWKAGGIGSHQEITGLLSEAVANAGRIPNLGM